MRTSGSTIGDASYVAVLRRLEFEPEVHGPWAHVGHTDGVQGWKLHLSSTPRDARTLLECALPVLRRACVAFKVARDAATLTALNEGELGATQVGKFATIYPPSDEACEQLAAELVAVTAGRIGPIVTTDLRLGDVVYARYGCFNPVVGIDRLGQTVIAIRAADGSLVADRYQIPFVPPPDIANPFEVWPLAGARETTPRTSELFGPGYLVLGVVETHAKGSVFYALDVRGQETAGIKILKQGRQHCLADAHGRDIRDRLRHQQALHEKLFGFVPIPKVDPYFEVDGDGYLALEFIDGETIEHAALRTLGGRAWPALPVAERRRLLGLLHQLVVAVHRLHARGIAHRGLNASSVWVAEDDTVYLLDLEIAHAPDDPTPPFATGTIGFMSPQQAAGQPPSFADDVFALGALCLLTLTGLDPCRLLGAGRDRTSKWQALAGGGADVLVACASRCVSDAPTFRPGLEDIQRAVARELGALEAEAALAGGARRDQRHRSERSAIRDLAASGIRGLCQDAPRDEATGLWLSPPFKGESGGGRRDAYTVQYDAHRGIAGVVYGLARAARIGLLDDAARADAQRALHTLLDDAPSELAPLPGLHVGTAGVAVAVAEAASVGLVDTSAALTSFVTRALGGDLDWPDITHGAAGQGIAALLCADRLEDPEIAARAHRAADYLIATQRDDGSWVMPPGVDGMSGDTLTGFAHGTSGIVYFLLEYARRFDAAAATAAWRAGAEWVAGKALEVRDGEALEWPYSVERPERWRFWCHGGPGIALMWLRAWQATRDERFAMLARRALAIHPRNFRHSNLSQCHGLSGLGEIYLEAWHVLGDGEFHDRASEVAAVLSYLAQTSPSGSSSWLVEDPHLPCADLMVGASGVVHFLLRYSRPESDMGPPLLLNRHPSAPCSAS